MREFYAITFQSGEDYDLLQSGRSMTLTESLKDDLVNLREQRVSELVNTDWYPPKRTGTRRYVLLRNFHGSSNIWINIDHNSLLHQGFS